MPDYIVYKQARYKIPVHVDDVLSAEEAIDIAYHDGGDEDDSNIEFVEYLDSSTWEAEQVVEDAPILRLPLQRGRDAIYFS